MNFHNTDLPGVHLISTDLHSDQRGEFFRAFCSKEFELNMLETNYVQSNVSFNKISGTVRGMHYQKGVDAEVKVVRCTSGSIFDVVVDLRKNSPTYLKWFGAELSEKNRMQMYVPKGCAHGYQALEARSSVHYLVSNFYKPESEFGIRWNDPTINIKWPLCVTSISKKDASWPLIGN